MQVEIFGCDTDNEGMMTSRRFADYPRMGYQITALYMEDEDRVLSCGGYLCEGDIVSWENCKADVFCYTIGSSDPAFKRDGDLMRGRQNHKMFKVENVFDLLSTKKVPMIFGGIPTISEIYNPSTNTWSDYRVVPDRNWFGTDCVTYFDESIWRVRRDLS